MNIFINKVLLRALHRVNNYLTFTLIPVFVIVGLLPC